MSQELPRQSCTQLGSTYFYMWGNQARFIIENLIPDLHLAESGPCICTHKLHTNCMRGHWTFSMITSGKCWHFHWFCYICFLLCSSLFIFQTSLLGLTTFFSKIICCWFVFLSPIVLVQLYDILFHVSALWHWIQSRMKYIKPELSHQRILSKFTPLTLLTFSIFNYTLWVRIFVHSVCKGMLYFVQELIFPF